MPRSPRRVRSPLVVLLAGLMAILASPWRSGRADDPPAGEDRMKLGHCGCKEGKACWHYLRSPIKPPEDPCRCGLCKAKGNCSTKDRPDGWSGECMGSQELPCFWKRHAASWGITCSECWADAKCPTCNDILGLPNADTLATLRKQAAKEGDGPKHKMMVGWTSHFYVVTDIQHWKLITQEGGPRVADQHEVVHLFLERAEKAYDDFVAAFQGDVQLGKPMGIFLAERKATKEGWQSAYFGNSRTNMLYGGGTNAVSGGFCWNGFALAADEQNTDRDMHATVRHMIGHILFSCWHGVAPFRKNCPTWAFCGVADWLCKSDPLFVDYVTFCQDEGPVASGSGKEWDKKAKVIAGTKHDPIEKLFNVASLSHMSYDDLVRSWSYFDLMLREDRERWLATLRLIREGQEHAVAFRKGMGMTPDEFDKRWIERETGSRRTMGVDPKKDGGPEDAEGPGGAERRRIRSEQDTAVLAALLRGLEKVADLKMAALVTSKFGMDSDLIRETVVLLLTKTESPEVIQYLREQGLKDSDALVRAGVARVLGALKDAAARPTLEALLDDPHWLCRAYAAQALQAIADPASIPVLLAHVEDTNPKAWIAKADALGVYGPAASKATVAVCGYLAASDWQVRLTACRVLASIGDKDAVDPLIERLDTEGGRLKREILKALRAVSHETFGENAQTWRNWWKRQKPSGIPPELPKPSNPEDDRYAKPKKPGEPDPTYYGRRMFSQSVLFVIDVSKSMDTFIRIPDAIAAKLGHLTPGPRIQVAKSAISQAVQSLDTRARFNIVFFSTEVHPWKDNLVFAAPQTKEAAISAIQAWPLEDETNIYGALRAAVGLHQKPTLSATLDPIPDTIYFLTDGTPTRGEITDNETILSWMRDVNRFAKVDLHVIAMGNLGVDLVFLERLATENGGEFIHVAED